MDTECIEPRTGLVGFFDILGYGGFLRANKTREDLIKVTTQVLSTLVRTKEQVSTRFQHLSEQQKSEVAVFHDRYFEWLVFSDTILLTTDLSKSSEQESVFLCESFLMHCGMLYRHMFNFGMPVRGAIREGTFVIKGPCFAGKPIVEAHECTKNLDAAICTVGNDVRLRYESLQESANWGNWNEIPFVISSYNIPFKKGEPEDSSGISVLVPEFLELSNEAGWKEKDLRQEVFQAFWKHKKQMDKSVVQKATNTEQFLRYLKAKLPETFN